MSLDKAIAHGKEKRKPYRGSKAIDCTCRNHGSCQWCVENRTHKFRDKESESMRIETTYYADDGVAFCSEEDCLAYENRKKASFDSVMFFDERFVWHKNPDIPFIESDAVYLKVLDADDAKILFEYLYDVCGAIFPSNPKTGHIYGYDGNADIMNNYWVDHTDAFKKVSEIIEKVEKAVSKLGC